MARVRCVMMQKDEDLLLEPWLLYNGYLFGFENLVVFDNGSTHEGVLATLRRFEAAGVRVIRHFGTFDDWIHKGDLMASIIQAWDLTGGYDFAIPLDCDEFLALFRHDGLSCARDQIHAYLDSLVGREGVFSIETTNFNVPGQPGWFWPGLGAKRFFAAGTIGTLDHGFHIATSRMSDAVVQTSLTHLHLHQKPYDVVVEHARRKLTHYVDVDDRDALRDFAGQGAHLVRHLLQTREEYAHQFDGHLTFSFTGLGSLLAALGHQSALVNLDRTGTPIAHRRNVCVRRPATADGPARITPIDGDAYLARYLDVAAAGFLPLRHDLYGGFHEGRHIVGLDEGRHETPLPYAERP